MIQKNPNLIQIGGRSRSRNSKPKLFLTSTHENMPPHPQSPRSSSHHKYSTLTQQRHPTHIHQITNCKPIRIQRINPHITQEAISQQASSHSILNHPTQQQELTRKIRCLQNRVGELHQEKITISLNYTKLIQKLNQDNTSLKAKLQHKQQDNQDNSFYVMQPNQNMVIQMLQHKCEEMTQKITLTLQELTQYKAKEISYQQIIQTQKQQNTLQCKNIQEITQKYQKQHLKLTQLQRQVQRYRNSMQMLQKQNFQLQRFKSQEISSAMQEIRHLKQNLSQKQQLLAQKYPDDRVQSASLNAPLEYSNDFFSKLDEQCSQEYNDQVAHQQTIEQLKSQILQLTQLNKTYLSQMAQKDQHILSLEQKITSIITEKHHPIKPHDCQRCGQLLKTIFRLNQLLNSTK